MMLGTDPEFFILEKSTRRPVSAHKFFGDKKNPMIINGRYGGALGKLYRDGYVLELNLNQAPTCREGLCSIVGELLDNASHVIGSKHMLSAIPSMAIQFEKGMPADVMEFGCKPSLNAYTGHENVIEINGNTHMMRYAGGHMHFSTNGYDNDTIKKVFQNQEMACQFVKMLDLYVGLPLTYLTSYQETWNRRRHYGKAGEFRMQKYPGAHGIEYRTPDPSIWNNNALASMAFGVGRLVAFNYDQILKVWNPSLEPRIQEAINTGVGILPLIQNVPGWYDIEVLLHALNGGMPKIHTLITQDNLRPGTEGWHFWMNTEWSKIIARTPHFAQSRDTQFIPSIEVHSNR